jgi:signal transduction histidine kinase
MEQKAEITFYIIVGNIMLLVFITGIVVFIFQYRKKKIDHVREKRFMEEAHRMELLHAQVNTQQQTMQFIGSEIHDSVSQKLTLASLYTQRMAFTNRFPELQEQLDGVSHIINDTLLELRNLSKSLTDSKLQHAALDEILLIECEQVNTTGICTARLTTGGIPPIPVTIKSSLLRIAQEFIQNSLKHSGCKQIGIALYFTDKGLELTMEDDGRGFDAVAMQSQGMGLNNVQYRIEKIGGTYQLHTRAGAGTRMQLVVPASMIKA